MDEEHLAVQQANYRVTVTRKQIGKNMLTLCPEKYPCEYRPTTGMF